MMEIKEVRLGYQTATFNKYIYVLDYAYLKPVCLYTYFQAKESG